MSIDHDLECVDCGTIYVHVPVEYGDYPPCELCGGATKVNWEHGQAPSTDVFGCPTYSDATGEFHSSQREKIKSMKKSGFFEAGDKVGGARNEHRISGTSYFF
jgi:hypothetical protein